MADRGPASPRSSAPSPEQSRADLEGLLANGFDLRFRPPGRLAPRTLRQSSVLILFGALDRVPATSPVPTVPPELDVLLMRRSDLLRNHPGEISFPGGGAEPEDTGPESTALREAAEETGLDPAGIDVLGALPQIPLPVSNHLVTPVVGWWTSPSPVRADGSEAIDVFRTPVADLLHPDARGTSVLERGGASFRGEAFELTGGAILWGFTGVILSRLFDGLGWAVPWDAGREFRLRPGPPATPRRSASGTQRPPADR